MSQRFSRRSIIYSRLWAIVLALFLLGENSIVFAHRERLQTLDERAQRSAGRIIGLLEVPSIFRPNESAVPADASLSDLNKPIRAYAEASSKTGMVAIIQGPDDIDTRKDPYQRPAAVVYDLDANWYLIGLKSRGGLARGWVFVKNSNAFSWLESLMLLADNSGYLTEKWDGMLWTKPGGANVKQLKDLATRDISVRDTKRIDDELWLQVEITKQRTCDDTEEEHPVIASGWVRAYSISDELQVWFYPRGDC